MANKKVYRGLEYEPLPSLVRLARSSPWLRNTPSVLFVSLARFIGHLVPDEDTLEE